MAYYTVVSFKFSQPHQIIDAHAVQTNMGCLEFFDASMNLLAAFAPESWNKVRRSTDVEISEALNQNLSTTS
jgi:hypothetical protein